MKLPLPKFCIADCDPTGDEVWVVHTQKPLLLVKVQLTGLVGIRLHCWSPEPIADTHQLMPLLREMGEFYSAEVEHLEGMPEQWNYIFSNSFTPPEYLVCDNEDRNFTGILKTTVPRFVLLPHRQDISRIFGIIWLDEPPINEIELMNRGMDWWLSYCQEEDQAEANEARVEDWEEDWEED